MRSVKGSSGFQSCAWRPVSTERELRGSQFGRVTMVSALDGLGSQMPKRQCQPSGFTQACRKQQCYTHVSHLARFWARERVRAQSWCGKDAVLGADVPGARLALLRRAQGSLLLDLGTAPPPVACFSLLSTWEHLGKKGPFSFPNQSHLVLLI